VQAAPVERARQRLYAKMPDQRVLFRRQHRPEDRAKAPRIAQAQNLFTHSEVEMIMLVWLDPRRHQPKAA
jgi:hypothetical protein